jgi:hypothetical protein
MKQEPAHARNQAEAEATRLIIRQTPVDDALTHPMVPCYHHAAPSR